MQCQPLGVAGAGVAFFSCAFAKASLHAGDTWASFCFKQPAMRPPPRCTPAQSFSTSALHALRRPPLGGWSAARATPDENTNTVIAAFRMDFMGMVLQLGNPQLTAQPLPPQHCRCNQTLFRSTVGRQ